MRYRVGEQYDFPTGQFTCVASTLLKPREKRPFLIKLNLYAIGFMVLAIAATILIFGGNASGTLTLLEFLTYVFVSIVYIVIHEVLHGVSFVLFSKHKWSSIKFGLLLSQGLAYCISIVPVSIRRARSSLMMPLYVVCIPLYVIALVTTNLPMAIFAVILASGSIGDVYYLWKLRTATTNQYMIEELPTKSGYQIGYLLFEKQEEG